MASAQDLQKEQADKHGRKNTSVFKEGDYVLVSTKNLSSQAVSNLGSSKLLPRYLGPFKILKRSGNSYRIDLPSWMQTHPTFYVGLLKPYLRPDEPVTPEGGRATGSGGFEKQASDRETTEMESESADEVTSHPGHPSTPDAPDALPRPQVDGRDDRDRLSQPPAPAASRRRSPRLHRVDQHPTVTIDSGHGDPAPLASSASRSGPTGQGVGEALAPPRPPTASPPPAATRPTRKPKRPVRAPPPVLDRDGNRHYHVESIVGVRTQAGTRQLRVKWLGYPPSENSWVDEGVLREDCVDLVRDCERVHPKWFH
jgi:hypothetical protein